MCPLLNQWPFTFSICLSSLETATHFIRLERSHQSLIGITWVSITIHDWSVWHKFPNRYAASFNRGIHRQYWLWWVPDNIPWCMYFFEVSFFLFPVFLHAIRQIIENEIQFFHSAKKQSFYLNFASQWNIIDSAGWSVRVPTTASSTIFRIENKSTKKEQKGLRLSCSIWHT